MSKLITQFKDWIKKRKVFDNSKPVVYIILVFVILFFSIRSCEASSAELGPTLLDGYGIVYTESITDKWDVGLVLISEQNWDHLETGNNGGIFIERLVTYKRFSMGLGAAGWIGTSRLIGEHLGFNLSLHYELSDKLGLHIRHWSNAGTAINNRGQDLITLGWKFD